MQVTRLRSLLRKRGPLALPVVAGYMALRYVKHHKVKTGVCLALLGVAGGAYLLHRPQFDPSLAVIDNRLEVSQDDEATQADVQVAPEEETEAYAVAEIGTLGGDFSQSADINGRGQVVGASRTSERAVHGYIWKNGKLSDVGTLGGRFSAAYGINDNGQVVGTSLDRSEKAVHAFVWKNGKCNDANPRGAEASIASAINRDGDFIGSALTPKGDVRGFLRSGNSTKDLGVLPGCDFTLAQGMNDRDDVVGYCVSDEGDIKAFFWQNGKMRALSGLNGAMAVAFAINESGAVAGLAFPDDNSAHAVVWQGGKPKDLGLISGYPGSAAFAISRKGDVVGMAFDYDEEDSAWEVISSLGFKNLVEDVMLEQGNGEILSRNNFSSLQETLLERADEQKIPHAVLWSGGKATDLNDLLPSNSGWVLALATGINADGQITGIGVHNNAIRGFVLTPKR